jgi:hypothetical protein
MTAAAKASNATTTKIQPTHTLIRSVARAALVLTRLSRMGSVSLRSWLLADRRYWAPTGRPCRLLARACSIVAAYSTTCWLRAASASTSAG